jgi:hypothetical protein
MSGTIFEIAKYGLKVEKAVAQSNRDERLVWLWVESTEGPPGLAFLTRHEAAHLARAILGYVES